MKRAVDLRHERCTLRRFSRVLAPPHSTAGRVLKAPGPRLAQEVAAGCAGPSLPVGTARRHDPR